MGEIWKDVVLEGHKRISMLALIDTGASLCYMSQSLAKKVGAFIRPGPPQPTRLANKRVVQGRQGTVILGIDGYEIPVKVMIVPKVDGDFLIGLDFLQSMGVELDFKDDSFKIPEHYKPRKIYRM